MLSGQNCDENGYCNKQNAYLQVWAILLGQFDVADYQTTFSVIAFVAFTFVTFIVLGYALIATSIDIYNKVVTFALCANGKRDVEPLESELDGL